MNDMSERKHISALVIYELGYYLSIHTRIHITFS